MDFSGKTVIVTGSGAGMGRAAAVGFAKLGASLVVNSVSDSAAKVCDELVAQGFPAVFVKADVSEMEGAKSVIETAVKTYGGIDVLVNAAGVVANGSVEECEEETWTTR